MYKMLKSWLEWYYDTKTHLILSSYLELVLIFFKIRKEAEFVRERKAVCKKCSYSKKTLGIRVCTVCSCIIQAMVVKEYSTCKKDRWQK